MIDWEWGSSNPRIGDVKDKTQMVYIDLDDVRNTNPSQAFSLPINCKSMGEVPETCKNVFWGEMLVNDGCPDWKFEWAVGYFVVFSDDKFGFLNLRNNYFHMFGRFSTSN